MKIVFTPFKLFFLINIKSPGPVLFPCCAREERGQSPPGTQRLRLRHGTRPEPEPGTQNTRVASGHPPSVNSYLSRPRLISSSGLRSRSSRIAEGECKIYPIRSMIQLNFTYFSDLQLILLIINEGSTAMMSCAR